MVGEKKYSQISHCNKTKRETYVTPPSMREIRRFLNSNTFALFTSREIILFESDVWLPPVNNRTAMCYYCVGIQQERSSAPHQPVSSSLTVPLPVRFLAPYARSPPIAVAPSPLGPRHFCFYTLLKPPSSNPSGSQHTTTTHTLTPS